MAHLNGLIELGSDLRVVAMIINEAYYALDAGVSSKESIDLAMKLGTGYPYGPFEWADRIGLRSEGCGHDHQRGLLRARCGRKLKGINRSGDETWYRLSLWPI